MSLAFESKIVKQVATEAMHVGVSDEGIVVSWPNLAWTERQQVEQAKAFIQALELMDEGQNRPYLSFVSDRGMTFEARKYFGKVKLLAPASAIVVHSPFQRLIATMAIKFSTSETPMRVFKTETEGLVWLREFL